MIKIYIGSEDFTNDASGLEDVIESYSQKEDSSLEISQSSTITFTGYAYEYIRDLILNDSCNSINNEYPVRVVIGKCKLSLDFIMKSQGVSIDTVNCKAKINLNAKNEKEEAFQILAKHVFWNEDFGFLNWALQNSSIPKMLHVHELSFITFQLTLFWFTFMKPLIAVVNVIIDTINAALWFVDADIKHIDTTNTDSDLLGGGEYTTAPYVRDILTFWAKKAGLNFKSSIFNSKPYSDSVLWTMQNDNGIDISLHKTEHVDKDNLPNLTTVNILNLIKPVFNAEWKIIGTDLIFERKDYFDNIRIKVFNLEQEIKAGNITREFEYTFNNDPNYARFISAFSEDVADLQGNKALKLYRYNKDYNKGLIHKNRKGDRNIEVKFGAVRCTEDFKKNTYMSFLWQDVAPIVCPKLTHSIVIENETAQLPKILVLDPRDTEWHGTKFKTVIRSQIKAPTGQINKYDQPDLTGDWEYNEPYWMFTLYGDSATGKGFHYIDDPDLNFKRIIEIPNIIWRPTAFCEAVALLRLNKLNTFIESKIGKGNISNFEVNYRNCTIKFSDITFKCQ